MIDKKMIEEKMIEEKMIEEKEKTKKAPVGFKSSRCFTIYLI